MEEAAAPVATSIVQEEGAQRRAMLTRMVRVAAWHPPPALALADSEALLLPRAASPQRALLLALALRL